MYSIIGGMITGGFLTVAFILIVSNPPRLIDGGIPAVDVLPAVDGTGHDIVVPDSGNAMICVNDNCITVLPDQNGDINIIG